MRRLQRIREALQLLNPHNLTDSSTSNNPYVCRSAVLECIDCLGYILFPEFHHPPSSIAPQYLDRSSLLEWVMGHVVNIMTTQLCFAFLLLRDFSAVENVDEFVPVKLTQQVRCNWEASDLPMPSPSSTGSPVPEGVHDRTAVRDHTMGDACVAPMKDKVDATTVSGGYLAHQDFSSRCLRKAQAIVWKFILERLPLVQWLLRTDVEAIVTNDVATTSMSEVVLCYPCVRCMLFQRVAHQLHLLGAPASFTRMLTSIAHSLTGIDIHPSTAIGHHFFIDHGTGIVIGATAVIGNHVSLYQGVTLGARNFPLDEKTGEKLKHLPRHPIIEDNVTIYANAVVLGRVTIGKGSTIGGNCWIVRSLPPFTSVVQRDGKVLRSHEKMFFEADGSGI